jgi:urease gamma subunit
MARELPQNQIRPAAQPVDAFVRPASQNTAAPAAPQMMPNPSGIRIIEQGSGGSVQGSNQFAQLAEALAPFSRALVDVAGAGARMYASAEYEKGQNEAMRAQVLANQQMQQSMGEYASENRKLAQVDPIGAVMMDRANPYREAGRINALSRVAAKEISSAVLDEYSRTPGVEEWQFGDPQLKQLQARAVARVAEKYKLDQGTPGFIDYVLPEVGQATDKLVAQHREDRTKYLQSTVPRLAVVEIMGVYENARKTGSVEWSEFDPVSGREVRRFAELSDKPAWDYGVAMRAAQIMDRMANESGLPGMSTEFKKRVSEELAGRSGDPRRSELARIVGGAEVGPIGKDGRRPTAAEMFGLEMLESRHKYGQMLWQEQQRTQQQGLQAFQSELATITFGVPDGPDRGAAIQQLIRKYEFNPNTNPGGIPTFELMKAAEEASGVGDKIAARSYSTESIEEFFLEIGEQTGSGWNAAAADAEYRRRRDAAPPQDRSKYDQQYASIRKEKEREKDDVPGYLVDPLINRKINTNIKLNYPGDPTEAALRGADITKMLAWGDLNIAASQERQQSAYRRHVYSRLADAKRDKGGQLNAAEATAVISKALEEYGKNDKDAVRYLFPGSSTLNTPGIQGIPVLPPAAGSEPIKPPPGRQAYSQPVYSSGQLDNIPNRAQRLKAGEPVLSLPSAQEEATRILNGRAPSAAVSRAAKDAGLTPGKFLLQQLDGYPSFQLPADARRDLLRSSRGAQGITDAARTASGGQPRPVEMAAMWFFDALTGARPAAATTLPPLQGGGRNGGGPFMDRPVAAVGPINVDSLRRAIVGKESGGSFSAVNRDSGALGYGQVMPANVPSWTREHYGRSLTPKQFLANKEAQLAVVNGQISKIVRQQLAAGYKGDIAIRRAAAIWYSGQGNLYDDRRPQSTNGRSYPSIRDYTLDILRRYSQGG